MFILQHLDIYLLAVLEKIQSLETKKIGQTMNLTGKWQKFKCDFAANKGGWKMFIILNTAEKFLHQLKNLLYSSQSNTAVAKVCSYPRKCLGGEYIHCVQ